MSYRLNVVIDLLSITTTASMMFRDVNDVKVSVLSSLLSSYGPTPKEDASLSWSLIDKTFSAAYFGCYSLLFDLFLL